MRTKTLLLTAVLGVAAAATSMADVFSVNVVGYVNRTIPSGFSIISNPLQATNNSLATIIPSMPENSKVYRFINGAYTIINYAQDDNGVLGWDANPTILPGEGFFVFNTGATVTNTFVGEVPQGTSTNAIVAGFNLKSSTVPQSAALDTVLGYPAAEGDAIYLFRNGQYTINNYEQDDNGVLGWSLGSAPVPQVGEGFFIKSVSAKNPGWVRTFTVN